MRKNTRNSMVLASFFTFFLLSCSAPKPTRSIWFKMDTAIELTLFNNLNASISNEEIAERVRDFLSDFDRRFSPSSQNSEVKKINNRQSDTVQISHDLYKMIEISLAFSKKTDGLFDITVKPLSDFWNVQEDRVGSENFPDPGDLIIADTLAKILKNVNFANISLLNSPKRAVFANPKTQIDLGTIAKSFAIQNIIDTLHYFRFSDFIINIGGDIYASGRNSRGRPIVVGVRHPRERAELLHILQVDNKSQAVFTSGDYERFRLAESGQRVHHIMDTRTGFPATKNISLTIIGESVIVSDILSTAFFGLGASEIKERLLSFENYNFILVDSALNIVSPLKN